MLRGHLLFLGGWLFAFIYYFIFASLGHASWWFGALVRMAIEYEGPSYYRTPLATLFAHALYGAVLGATLFPR